MTWFKVDDHLHSHRKTMRAGTAAMGLWVLAGSWSAAEESDGWVPHYVLPRLVGAEGEQLAEQLVAAGLWAADEHDGEDGYRFLGWEDYQPTRASLEQRRARNREHMAGIRAKRGGQRVDAHNGDVDAHNGDVDAHKLDSGEPVDSTPTRPDPTPSNPSPDGEDETAPSSTSSTAGKTKRTPADKAGEPFARFWSTYPRKVGKQDAARAWQRATAHTDPETIHDGLANQLQVWRSTDTDPRFIPHPATWLNRGSWDDEQPLPGAPAAGGPRKVVAWCGNTDPHGAHDYADGRNACTCPGEVA